MPFPQSVRAAEYRAAEERCRCTLSGHGHGYAERCRQQPRRDGTGEGVFHPLAAPAAGGRLDLANCAYLCATCHELIHTRGEEDLVRKGG